MPKTVEALKSMSQAERRALLAKLEAEGKLRVLPIGEQEPHPTGLWGA